LSQLVCSFIAKKHRKPSKYLDIRNSCMKDLRRLRAMALAFQAADLRNHKNVEPEDILHKSHSKEKHLGDSKLSSNSWTQSSREHQSQRQNLVKTISKLVIAVTGRLTKTSGLCVVVSFYDKTVSNPLDDRKCYRFPCELWLTEYSKLKYIELANSYFSVSQYSFLFCAS